MDRVGTQVLHGPLLPRHDGGVSVLLVAAVAVGVGWTVRRWWLLALPVAMVAGALLLVMMPGSSISRDNPLPFLALLLEAGFAAGIVAGRRRV